MKLYRQEGLALEFVSDVAYDLVKKISASSKVHIFGVNHRVDSDLKMETSIFQIFHRPLIKL